MLVHVQPLFLGSHPLILFLPSLPTTHSRGLSLNGLTEKLVGAQLNKSKSITCSDWEKPELTEKQVQYAAADAIAGLLIFEKLVERKLPKQENNQKPSSSVSLEAPPQGTPTSGALLSVGGASSTSILTSAEGMRCAVSLCQGSVDVGIKDSRVQSSASMSHHRPLVPRRTSSYSVRSQPLYHNCQLKGPDGTLLANVDKRKMHWYLDRNLAGGCGYLVSVRSSTFDHLL